MDGLEDKISAFLSSPGAMEQVLSMAKALGGGEGGSDDAPEESERHSEDSGLGGLGALGSLGGLGDMLGGVDPATLSKIMGLLGEYNKKDDRRENLLKAVKPYLRKERQDNVGRALQIVKLARTAQSALGEGNLLGKLF